MPHNIHLVKNELLENIFKYANNSIAIVGLDGQWIKVNTSLTKMLGYSAAELYQFTFQDITHKDDLDLDLDYVDQLLNGERDEYQMEKRYFHKSGKIVWVILSVSLVRNNFDQPMYFIAQMVDITDTKEAKWEIDLLIDVVQKQNTRLKNFAEIVTHDIRTHLGNLLNIAEFINEENEHLKYDGNFRMLKEALNNIEGTLEHLNQITVGKLLESDDLKSLNLNSYVSRAIYNINAIARNNNCFIVNRVKPEHNVLAIEAYLDSIILNFLSNAVKYKSNSRTPVIKLFSEQVDKFIVLHIQDNGLGIDLETNGDKLFQLNETFHNHTDSRGVGLHITKKHIESIGGKIEVKSQVDKGSIFSIYFEGA